MEKAEVIQITVNPATKGIGLSFDKAKFGNWNYVIAILEGAVETAKDIKRVEMMKQIEEQAAMERQAQQIKQIVTNGR